MAFVTVNDLLRKAFEHHRAGRLADAEQAYRQVLTLDPRSAEALHLLGVIAQQQARTDESIRLIRTAIAVDPSQSEFYYNLGNSLMHAKRFADAAEAFALAVARKSDFFEAQRNL